MLPAFLWGGNPFPISWRWRGGGGRGARGMEAEQREEQAPARIQGVTSAREVALQVGVGLREGPGEGTAKTS